MVNILKYIIQYKYSNLLNYMYNPVNNNIKLWIIRLITCQLIM